jgi:hypothetical protein
MDNTQNPLVQLDQVMMGAGVIIIMVVVFVGSYILYKKFKEKSENDTDYEGAKTNLQSTLNSETSKNIIAYINTIQTVHGNELVELKEQLEAKIAKLEMQSNKKINDNKTKIDYNKATSLSNIKRSGLLKNDIKANETRINKLRQSIEYDDIKIILAYIEGYIQRFAVTTPVQKNMLLSTNLLGLLEYYDLFTNYQHSPDLLIKDKKIEIDVIINKLLTQFIIYPYYVDIEKIHLTNYNTININDVPVINYISKNREFLTLNTDFILKTYLPKLIDYIIQNLLDIYNDIDILINSYFMNYPVTLDNNTKSSYFNTFFTSINIDELLLDDNDHLITKIIKYVYKDNYSDWSDFKIRIANFQILNRESLYLLFNLIPEYLIMMKYNLDNVNKYDSFSNSELLINIPETKLTSLNIKNFHDILEYFTCANENFRNDGLKIKLSDSLTTMYTVRRQLFENTFIPKYTKAVNKFSVSMNGSLPFTFDNFVCDPIGEEVSINPIMN